MPSQQALLANGELGLDRQHGLPGRKCTYFSLFVLPASSVASELCRSVALGEAAGPFENRECHDHASPAALFVLRVDHGECGVGGKDARRWLPLLRLIGKSYI